MRVVELEEGELKLVKMALVSPAMKEFIQTPSTPYIVRQIYKSLMEKLKNAKEKGIVIMPD